MIQFEIENVGSAKMKVICVGGFVAISRKLPENKGKSLEAIERELAD